MKRLLPVLMLAVPVLDAHAAKPAPVALPSVARVEPGIANPNIFVQLAKKIVPSVVNISTMSTVSPRRGRGGTPDDLFRKFFEDYLRQREGGDDEYDDDEEGPGPGKPPGAPRALPRSASLGSGFIIDASGLILTNNHVVADADEIKIHFTEEADEKPTDGEVVGRDPELDLALIRVKSKRQMIALPLGDSDALEVGEYVLAVGNPFGQGHSVTHGIISAKNREAPDFRLANYIQTDAPINPGNSGGPLVNLKGEVIGINNAIFQGAQGIGFAIPANFVKSVLPQLKTKGTVSRGYIGVLINELSPEVAPKIGASKDLRAPFVTHVYPGEPADKAGIKPYDVILEFNGKPVRSGGDLVSAVTAVPVDQSVPIKVSRSGSEKVLQIKVSQRPDETIEAKVQPKSKKKKPARFPTGMQLEDLTPDVVRDLGLSGDASGAVVSDVEYGSVADEAGLMRGDLIVEVDRKPIKGVEGFYATVKEPKAYLLRVRRIDPQNRDVFAVILLDLKASR